MPHFETLILSEPAKHILMLTLNRPERCNAINSVMMKELCQFWETYNKNERSSYRVIILTGNGKHFCAGADLKERAELDLKTWYKQHAPLEKAMIAMMECRTPIVAAVNGSAFGGGLELTLASDFAYASDTAIFSQSETKLGIMPGAMGTQNLPIACGLRRAKELTLTGNVFGAKQALDWNIVNAVFTLEQLLEQTLLTAQTIAPNAPMAIAHSKLALNAALKTEIHSGYEFEIKLYNQLIHTTDRIEGINAFNEKRKPDFTGK